MDFAPEDFASAGLSPDPFKAIVGPRPIGWISTISKAGVANLAPYSFFNTFATEPYYVAFGSGGVKDSMRNIEETGEFVVNLTSLELAEAMNKSSATIAEDEFGPAGLAKGACVKVKAPRVLAAPASLECRHFQTVALPGDDGAANDFLIIGRVVHVHLDPRFVEGGRVNTGAMKLIARLGYSEYATVDSTWRMRRPD